MQTVATFHQIRECPSCESYWRRTGRQAVGMADYGADDTCPSCRPS